LKTTYRTRELPNKAMGNMMIYNTVKMTCKDSVVDCTHVVISVPFPEMQKKEM